MIYNTKKIIDDITFNDIINETSEEAIYQYYLGKQIKINKPISSPFREDKNPSWSLYRGRKYLRYMDFATGESGNVIDFVKKKEGLGYKKTLELIWNDLVINGYTARTNPFIEKNNKTIIGIKRKNFTKTDDIYWKQFNISRNTLKKFNVTPIEKFWVNEVESPLIYDRSSPMYAYKVFDKFKIYRPYSIEKKDKWRNNCNLYDLQGLEQLPKKGKLLIITKSLKDVMVLYEFGYTAIAPQSEQSNIPKSLLKNLKERFEKITVFFDYDEGGLSGAKKLAKQHSIDYIFIDKFYLDIYNIKDISDFTKEMSKEKTLELLKQLFNG